MIFAMLFVTCGGRAGDDRCGRVDGVQSVCVRTAGAALALLGAADARRLSFSARRQPELARACSGLQCSGSGVRLRLSRRLAAIATGFACGSVTGRFCATPTKLSRVSSVHGYAVGKDLTQRVIAAGSCTWTLCGTSVCRVVDHITSARAESDLVLVPKSTRIMSSNARHDHKDTSLR